MGSYSFLWGRKAFYADTLCSIGSYNFLWGRVASYGAIQAPMGPYGATPPPPRVPIGPHRFCPTVKRRRAAPKGAAGDADVGRPIRTGSAQFVRELRGRTFPR